MRVSGSEPSELCDEGEREAGNVEQPCIHYRPALAVTVLTGILGLLTCLVAADTCVFLCASSAVEARIWAAAIPQFHWNYQLPLLLPLGSQVNLVEEYNPR